MMIQLAAYQPHRWHDLIGRLVCLWTGYPYSHCELVIDGVCYSSSARDGGVRGKRIDLSPEWWHLVEIRGYPSSGILARFNETKGVRYGWLDILCRQILHLPIKSKGYFCSEWCAYALGLPEPTSWTPGMLVEYFDGMKQ